MGTKILLPHQGNFLQVPYLYPETRFHFMVCGYGAGKSSCLASIVVFLVTALQGKKDFDNHNPRILLGGVNLGHLLKTTVKYVLEDLTGSGVKYTFNKKDNIITVGSVDILIISLADPGTIKGYDVVASILDELDDLDSATSDDKAFEAMRAVNERTRQAVKGFRQPFVQIACLKGNTKVVTARGYIPIKDVTTKDMVMTRYGWRPVKASMLSGEKEVIRIAGIYSTIDHPFLDKNEWKCASVLDKRSVFTVYSTIRSIRWQKLSLRLAKLQERVLLSLTELSIHGHTANVKNRVITGVTLIKVFLLLLSIKIFGRRITGRSKKAMLSITKILIQEIMILKTLFVSRRKNMTNCTERIRHLIESASTVEKSFLHEVLVSTDVMNVKKSEDKNKTEYGISRGEKEHIEGYGKKRNDLLFVQSVEKDSSAEVKQRHSVLFARIKGIIKYLLSVIAKKRKAGELVSTPASVMCAENNLLPGVELHTALKNAMTTLIGGIAQEDLLISQKRYALVVRVLDVLINGLRKIARTAKKKHKVYDLTVNVPNGCDGEFFIKTALGNIVAHNTTSQGQRGLYRIYTNFKKTGVGFTLLRGRTQDNVFQEMKSPGYTKSLYKFYSPKEALVYLEGMFLAVTQGRVFPDFDWDKNYINVDMDLEVGDDETIFYSSDFNSGFNKATAFILRGKTIFGIKFYDFPDARTAPQVIRHDFPRNKIYFIPDNTSTKEILSYFKELRKYNIRWIAKTSNPNVEDSVFTVNKLLYSRRLVFTRAARDTAEAVAGFMRDKNNQVPKGKGPLDYAHVVDGCRYACTFMTITQAALRDVYRFTLRRHIEQKADDAQAVTEMDGGYVDINTEAI